MTWTYSNNPTSIPRDQVRFLIADTDQDIQLVTDEEIAFALDAESDDTYMAASLICLNLAMQFARKADVSLDSAKVSYTGKADQYKSLAASLKEKSIDASGSGIGVPFVGGVSISQMDSVNSNSDRVQPAFKRDQFSNTSSQVNDLYGNS